MRFRVLGFRVQGVGLLRFRVLGLEALGFGGLGLDFRCFGEVESAMSIRPVRVPKKVTLRFTQRAQYALIQEYSLNHNMKPYIM